MRYLIARGPDGTGMVGGARTLREAKAIAGVTASQIAATSRLGGFHCCYIIDGRSGKVRTVRHKATPSTNKGG